MTQLNDDDDAASMDDEMSVEETGGNTSNSSSDDDDDDDDEQQEDGEEDSQQQKQQQQQPLEGPTTAATVAATLSKSWSIASAHVPTFSGGQITVCRTRGVLPLGVDEKSNPENEDVDSEEEERSSQPTPFLLLPMDGDLAIVDAHKGTQIQTVRGNSQSEISGYGNQNDEDDDDDDGFEEGLDSDAILSYALSWNDATLLTCSRNQLIRQYTLPTASTRSPQKASQNNSTSHNNTTLSFMKLWGRSGHTLPVQHMSFHKSNVFVATGSVDGTVRVWDVRHTYTTHVFRPTAAAEGQQRRVSGVTAIQWKETIHDLILAIGREDGTISIHDLRQTNQPQQRRSNKTPAPSSMLQAGIVLRDHDSAVTSMNWVLKPGSNKEDNSDVGVFVSTGRDSVINTWKVTDNNHYRRIHTIPLYEQIESMVVLPYQNYNHSYSDNRNRGRGQQTATVVVATAGSKGVVRLWEMTVPSSSEASSPHKPPFSKFRCIAEQPEPFGEAKGGYLDMKFTPQTHNGKSHKEDGDGNDDKAFFGLGQLVVADAEHNLLFLNLANPQKLLQNQRTIVGHNDEILDLKLLPQRRQNKAVVATNSAQVRVFDLDTFSCNVLDGHTATVLCVDISPCGRFIATCGKDKTMRIWNTGSSNGDDKTAGAGAYSSLAIATGHTEAIGGTALSRKMGRYDVVGKAAENGGGSFAVTASKDRTLKRWNLPGAKVMLDVVDDDDDTSEPISLKASYSVRAHEKDINIVSVAPNDSLVATGSQDKTIKLWKATDLSLQGTLKGHKRGVWDCQFSPYDRVLASCSGDRTVKLWSLSDRSCVRTFQGHLASALRVRFLSGGLQLVSSGADGLVKLWTIRSNECEATMDGHRDKVWAMDLDVNGRQLVSGGADSRIVVWNDTTKAEEDAKRKEEQHNILLEQQLANHLRFKEFEKALELALDLQKPMQVLKVLNALVENDIQNRKSGLTTLQGHAKKWSDEKLLQILRYCRDWNTRARNSHMAMLVVQAVVTSIPAHTLAAVDGLPEILAGITPYAERHFERLDRLQTSSYLVDFVLGAMGSLDDDIADEYAAWEASSKLVLPPRDIDGRIQIGGTAVLGSSRRKTLQNGDGVVSDDEVVTIGESDTSDDESDQETQ